MDVADWWDIGRVNAAIHQIRKAVQMLMARLQLQAAHPLKVLLRWLHTADQLSKAGMSLLDLHVARSVLVGKSFFFSVGVVTLKWGQSIS